jgi:hypothetical protein
MLLSIIPVFDVWAVVIHTATDLGGWCYFILQRNIHCLQLGCHVQDAARLPLVPGPWWLLTALTVMTRNQCTPSGAEGKVEKMC